MEKESIGIFITEHPLKRVREALKVKTDCVTSEVINQRDGEWVKVGGMITESKKIKTRSGSTMMFATLDDLDGSVEIVVFEKALAAAEEVIADDAIVLVRGRVDHKEAGKVCVIVQEVDEVRPHRRRDREGQGPGRRRRRRRSRRRSSAACDAAQLPATVIDDLRDLFERYPGETRVRARDAHPHGPAAPEVRRRLPRPGARRGPARRARRAARADRDRRRLDADVERERVTVSTLPLTLASCDA